MSFDPCNCSLKIWEYIGIPIPKVGVHLGMWGFIPSHSLALSGAWNVVLALFVVFSCLAMVHLCSPSHCCVVHGGAMNNNEEHQTPTPSPWFSSLFSFIWVSPLHPYSWFWCWLGCLLVLRALLWCVHAPLHTIMLRLCSPLHFLCHSKRSNEKQWKVLPLPLPWFSSPSPFKQATPLLLLYGLGVVWVTCWYFVPYYGVFMFPFMPLCSLSHYCVA